jgi:tRNA(Glu) U13 pseudouridine synthase TruD
MKCIVDAVLEEEGIVRKDFNLEQLPMLSSRGTYREIVVKPSEFSFEQTGEGVYVRFSLSRGQYATVLLEHLFS